MFDSLSHAELVTGLGSTMRAAAKGDAVGRDEFARVQFLSGSSIARYLAEELRYGPALWAWFVDTVAAELADPPAGTDPETAAGCVAAGEQIRAQPAPERVGEVLAELLVACRARRGGEPPGPVERLLRHRLRELADHQVTMLTGADPLAAQQHGGSR